MHLKEIRLHPDKYPTNAYYPFNLPVFNRHTALAFNYPITFLVGENGSGKSTLIEALARKTNIHIWENAERRRMQFNPYENKFHQGLSLHWHEDKVPGAFFGSQTFHDFTHMLDEWALVNPELLDYFGGESLRTKSHGESLMAYFRARYEKKGIYLMDEPETALSAKSILELLKLLENMAERGHAQFIIATHSPILMSAAHAQIYSFEPDNIRAIEYKKTDHYRIYREFFNSRTQFMAEEKSIR